MTIERKLTTFLASCAYTGYSPVVPGTVGTFWGVLIWYLIAGLGPLLEITIVLVFILLAMLAASLARKNADTKDPSFVVIDEVAGFLVTSLIIPFTIKNALIAFVLFRIFDVLKPFPVNTMDRLDMKGLGIVLDDIAAGIYANIAARVLIWYL
ncbi:MAG: phosphatidylglycerophosphatase A [Deltaproteobacteria bacterium]|nr:phosphatidylglycerophosphatase A [Deltaproteobacteria bacterium]